MVVANCCRSWPPGQGAAGLWPAMARMRPAGAGLGADAANCYRLGRGRGQPLPPFAFFVFFNFLHL
jgi:hypothetical protein